MSASAEFWQARPKTLKFIKAMSPHATACPLHLLACGLHESGHAIMALCHGVLPCRAYLKLDDAGRGLGGVCSRCDSEFARLAPRQQAHIAVAGAAAGRLYLDAGDSSALLSEVDAQHIEEAGLKPDDPRLMREAEDLFRTHSRALLRFVVLLANRRELTRRDIITAVLNDPAMQSVRKAGGFVAMREVGNACV